jgi:hypothetical protein
MKLPSQEEDDEQLGYQRRHENRVGQYVVRVPEPIS